MKLDADSVAVSSLTLDPDYADAAEVQRIRLNKTKSRDRDHYKNWWNPIVALTICSSFWHIILSSLHFGCTQSAAKLWSWRRSWPILLSSRARAPSWARDWAQVSTLSRAAFTSSAVRCPPTGRSLTARSLTANVLANSRKRDWKQEWRHPLSYDTFWW